MKRGDVVTIYRPQAFNHSTWFYGKFEAKVMCVCDGYVMLRKYPGMPFVYPIKQLDKWKLNPPPLVQDAARKGGGA